jgi:glycosyltransferase involved in cell wall biosynthesis
MNPHDTAPAPRISIITACFNSEGTLIDTLQSVNSQSYPEIEHIIVDGASRDRTLDVVRERGQRVTKVLSEPDRGIYDAFNKGLKLARGEIIGILNSDDFYVSAAVIAKVMDVFRDPSVEAVYADLVYVDRDDTTRVVRHWKSHPYRSGDFGRAFMPAHPTLFLRRSVYDRVGFFDPGYRFAGDYEFMLRAFHVHGLRSVYLPEIVVRMRTGGTTGGPPRLIYRQNREILRALSDSGVRVFKPAFFARKLVDRLMQRIRAPFARVPG